MAGKWALDCFFDWLDGKDVDPVKCVIEHGVGNHDHDHEEEDETMPQPTDG